VIANGIEWIYIQPSEMGFGQAFVQFEVKNLKP